jgi:hypothetical protein
VQKLPGFRIKALQFGLGTGDVGQIPAFGRGGPPRSPATVQRAPAREDTVDGSHRRHRGDPLPQERLPDGVSTDGAQVAVSQFSPGLQDQILQGGLGAPGVVRCGRAIRPVHAIQTLPFGSLDPVGHGGDPHTELTGDGVQGLTSADSGDHGPTTLGLTL